MIPTTQREYLGLAAVLAVLLALAACSKKEKVEEPVPVAAPAPSMPAAAPMAGSSSAPVSSMPVTDSQTLTTGPMGTVTAPDSSTATR